MARIGTINLTGASGTAYEFNVYTADTDWADAVACTYYVSKRTEKPGDGGSHSRIYVGETDNLKTRHADHHKQECFVEHGYNCISVHRKANADSRRQIEADLVKALKPPCND
jgi:hypothetical protein